VIYDEMGALTKRISLLRGAQRRKNAYVSANLATAYAKAGFIGDARDCLQQVSIGEQQENIVQAAYRTIKDQTESDRQITEKLDRLVKAQKNLFGKIALEELNNTDEELLQRFVGEWQLGESTIVRITLEAGKLTGAISTANSYYEHACYQVTAEYEPGLLQLDAQLDEGSLKERPTPNRVANALPGVSAGILGSLASPSLLGTAFNRPDERFKLILVPGEPDVLYGLRNYLTGRRSDRIMTIGKSEEEPQAMLNAREVQLTKRVAW
jgi:hypothetical protein